MEVFERAIAALNATFAVREIPLPPAHDVLGAAAAAASEGAWRRQCRRALLQWHPDKWAGRVGQADDPAALQRLTMRMTRAVLEEKQRGYNAP